MREILLSSEFIYPTLEKARWANLEKLPDRDAIRTSLGIKQDENLVLLIGSGDLVTVSIWYLLSR